MRTAFPCSTCHVPLDPDERECPICCQSTMPVKAEPAPASQNMTIELRTPATNLKIRRLGY